MKELIKNRRMMVVLCLGCLFLGGCVPETGMMRQDRYGYSREASYKMPEFPQKDLGDFYEKLSAAHREKLIRETLKERYTAGVSHDYEFVYDHRCIFTRKDGSTVEYSDYAIRINTPHGLNVLGEQTFPLRGTSQTIEILKASVYSPDGGETGTDAGAWRERVPYTGLIYSDLKVRTLSIRGLDVGSILRIAVKETYQTGGGKMPIFRQIDLDNYVPAKEKVRILRFEAGAQFQKKERIEGAFSETILKRSYTAGNGDNFYVYAVSGGKTREPEPGSVPVREFDNRVFFLTPRTWDEIAREYFNLSSPKAAVTEEISKKAHQLTKDIAGRDEKIKALYEYVRGIRYVAILLNQHETVPHEAGLTFKNRYGDCKDKATLLVTMLKAIGIPSLITLVTTSHLIDKELPSLSVFNHVIVAVPGRDGAYSFLDPTNSYTPYGMLPVYVQNRHALVVKEKGGEMVLVPPGPADRNRFEETIEIEVHDTEKATVATRSRLISPEEYYHRRPGFPATVLKQKLQQSLSRKYKECEVVSLKCDPVDTEGVLKMEKRLDVKDFSKRVGKSFALHPLFDADLIGKGESIVSVTRKSDLELDGPLRAIANVSIRIPESLIVEYIPASTSLKNDKFGEYVYRVTRKEDNIEVHRDFRLNVRRVSVRDYAEFREFYRACIRQDEEVVLLKKK
jgi:transglutaminase-like putative cysteine protease